MKNDAINRMKESKKRIDLLSARHICMLLAWVATYLIVWFQPESTLRTWVLVVSMIAIFHRVWAQGRSTGMSEVINGMIEGLAGKENSSDALTTTFQEIGNAGIKIKNKKEEKET